jgi:hypothetical protein
MGVRGMEPLPLWRPILHYREISRSKMRDRESNDLILSATPVAPKSALRATRSPALVKIHSNAMKEEAFPNLPIRGACDSNNLAPIFKALIPKLAIPRVAVHGVIEAMLWRSR